MTSPDFGALIISLDFELHWGVRDIAGALKYTQNLLGARAAVPRLLHLFDEHEIAATWATVGFLLARSRQELEPFLPKIRPNYENPALNPYSQVTGDDEDEDPLHFAGRLAREIIRAPRQELGSHTMSHYYCLEPGQDIDCFRADLQAAVSISSHAGINCKSLVFPRNQWNPAYESVLRECGITAFRSNQAGWMHRATSGRGNTLLDRGARLVDAYLPVSGRQCVTWKELAPVRGLSRIPATAFLRPISNGMRRFERLRLRRLVEDLRVAAKTRRVVHLWWHPHNFGTQLNANIDFLETFLREFRECRRRFGMVSLTMQEASATAHSFFPGGSRHETEDRSACI